MNNYNKGQTMTSTEKSCVQIQHHTDYYQTVHNKQDQSEQELNYDNICKKDENFEEITESKEIIEDRINKIKMIIVDYTIKQ